jgi:hypothetical protein
MDNLSVYDIYKMILANPFKEKYTYIILGTTGPTGKTWLATALRDRHGLNAIEITENIFEDVMYVDRKNHYTPDLIRKVVTIILNKPLDKEATDDGKHSI